MKPAAFAYHTPVTVDECLRLLAELGDDAALLAGGQSLLPLMRFRLAQPAHVISLRAIGGPVRAIRAAGDDLAIGAGVTYGEVQRSEQARAACPGLAQTIALIATPAVRSRGTVCGNLCQADPASELPALALIMAARFRLRSSDGERLVAAKDFFVGPYMTARRSNEMLTEVLFPVRPPGEVVVVREVTRLRGGFPLAGVAVSLRRGAGTQLRSVAIACFGVHSMQVRAPAAERVLEARGFTPAGLDMAGEALVQAIEPHADAFASVAYRRSAARTLLCRAVTEAFEARP